MMLDYSLVCGSTGLVAMLSSQKKLIQENHQDFYGSCKRKESGFHSAVFRKMSSGGSVMSMADHFLCNCHVTHVCVINAVLMCVVAGRLWISHAEAW